MGLTFSWVLSACQALMTEKMQEKTHGGALMSRVGTYPKPRVPVRVGYEQGFVSNNSRVLLQQSMVLTKKALNDNPTTYAVKASIIR